MKTRKVVLLGVFLLMAGFMSGPATGPAQANPLDGYNIHVTAPHMMNGEMVGPFHHFCKPISSEIVQCILFESDSPNARMTEVEYMVSKKLVRSAIPEWSHQKNWHDHKQEIETGRVMVVSPTDPKAVKGLVDFVAGTDGIIFHLWPKGAPIPDGSVSIAQSVGHWEATHGSMGQAAPASAPKASSTITKLTQEDYVRMGITGNH